MVVFRTGNDFSEGKHAFNMKETARANLVQLLIESGVSQIQVT